jgi:hypothetical protein
MKTDGNKQLIVIVIVAVVVAAGAFFGGVFYQSSKAPSGQARGGNGSRFGANGFPGGAGGPGGGMRRFGQNGSANPGDFTGGQVISKDSNSLTIKTRDGGSKIVYFSDSTQVGKFVKGSASDLKKGEQVTIMGKSSSDGSLSANNIQIRPAGNN